MQERKTITGENEGVIWEQVNADFLSGGAYDYHAIVQHENHHITLDVVRSPGGGAGGGYGTTTLSTPLRSNTDFRFSLQPEDVLNRLGKLFGMQDIKTGYPDFDRHVIVQANDEQKVKQLVSDDAIRESLQNMSGYRIHIVKHNEKHTDELELFIQRALFDVNQLRDAFRAFYHVLTAVEA
jgi:hypothetical protein